MYQVFLVAEDGDYCLTDPIPEATALRYVRDNEGRYGEGQRLEIRYCNSYY